LSDEPDEAADFDFGKRGLKALPSEVEDDLFACTVVEEESEDKVFDGSALLEGVIGLNFLFFSLGIDVAEGALREVDAGVVWPAPFNENILIWGKSETKTFNDYCFHLCRFCSCSCVS